MLKIFLIYIRRSNTITSPSPTRQFDCQQLKELASSLPSRISCAATRLASHTIGFIFRCCRDAFGLQNDSLLRFPPRHLQREAKKNTHFNCSGAKKSDPIVISLATYIIRACLIEGSVTVNWAMETQTSFCWITYRGKKKVDWVSNYDFWFLKLCLA